MWLNIGLSWKIRELSVFWLFFKVDLYSAVSFKRSRWVLSINMAEHRSILKKKEYCVFWLFSDIDLCSAISFKRSRRELSINMAEYRSTLKNYQGTNYSRFSFTLKTGKDSLKHVSRFYRWNCRRALSDIRLGNSLIWVRCVVPRSCLSAP